MASPSRTNQVPAYTSVLGRTDSLILMLLIAAKHMVASYLECLHTLPPMLTSKIHIVVQPLMACNH